MSELLVIGCGYLGRRLAERWLQECGPVLATTRSRTRADEFRAAGIEPVVCDVTEPATLTSLPRVVNVVHCIGLDRSAGKSMHEVYVQGLASLLARLPRPERFVFVSSTSVYGQRDGEEVDESSPTEPEEESGQIVLAAEGVLRQHLPEAIVLRFAGIYGPGRLLRGSALRSGEPLRIDPERWLNLIHVDDGVSAVLAALERGRPGETYIVSDGQPVTRREFYTEAALTLQAPPPRFEPRSAAAPLPPHERAHRRLRNEKMLRELGVRLQFPEYRQGLRGLV